MTQTDLVDACAAQASAESRPWRVYRMNQNDWWMARSQDEALQFFAETERCSIQDCFHYELLEDVRELTGDELDSLMFVDDDAARDDPTRKRSFRAELARRVRVERPEYPQNFASTER